MQTQPGNRVACIMAACAPLELPTKISRLGFRRRDTAATNAPIALGTSAYLPIWYQPVLSSGDEPEGGVRDGQDHRPGVAQSVVGGSAG